LIVAPSLATGADGTARLLISGNDPLLNGKPARDYIDGQIYLVDFRLPGQGNQARSSFDYIVLHVRNSFAAPAQPSWEDIEPILTQYSNLYPIMSQRLVRLSDQADVKRHARLVYFAFSQPITDANHMPVTRDLSLGRRTAILAWLKKILEEGEPALEGVVSAAAPALDNAPPSRVRLDHDGGKTAAARAFTRALGRST
jgi:hypothetical protein